METDPKPVSMWATYRPNGELILNTIKPDPVKSKLNAIHNFSRHSVEWQQLKNQGYRCIRVTVTPEVE